MYNPLCYNCSITSGTVITQGKVYYFEIFLEELIYADMGQEDGNGHDGGNISVIVVWLWKR